MNATDAFISEKQAAASAAKGDVMRGSVTPTRDAIPLHMPTEDPGAARRGRYRGRYQLETIKGMVANASTTDSTDEGGGE